MNPQQIAIETHQRIQELPWEENTDPRLETRGVYLGVFEELDPCHHCDQKLPALSFACRDFWRNLKAQLESYGMDLEIGNESKDRFATQHRQRKGQKRPYYVWGIDGDIERGK